MNVNRRREFISIFFQMKIPHINEKKMKKKKTRKLLKIKTSNKKTILKRNLNLFLFFSSRAIITTFSLVFIISSKKNLIALRFVQKYHKHQH